MHYNEKSRDDHVAYFKFFFLPRYAKCGQSDKKIRQTRNKEVKFRTSQSTSQGQRCDCFHKEEIFNFLQYFAVTARGICWLVNSAWLWQVDGGCKWRIISKSMRSHTANCESKLRWKISKTLVGRYCVVWMLPNQAQRNKRVKETH